MGVHIALTNINTPDGVIERGNVVPQSFLDGLANPDLLLHTKEVFYVYDDDELEPLVQWHTWGGTYPEQLRQFILAVCGGLLEPEEIEVDDDAWEPPAAQQAATEGPLVSLERSTPADEEPEWVNFDSYTEYQHYLAEAEEA